MDRNELLLVAGCPGSGKTHYLDELRSRGELDIIIQDGLEEEDLWGGSVTEIAKRLDDGARVGVCGQWMTTRLRREKLTKIFGDRARYVFFEPNYRACLINIAKGRLAGKPHAWRRACCVYAIDQEGRFQPPDDAELKPIYNQEITQEEIEEFFRIVREVEKMHFSVEGEAWLREQLTRQ